MVNIAKNIRFTDKNPSDIERIRVDAIVDVIAERSDREAKPFTLRHYNKCIHCGLPVNLRDGKFCCSGCEFAYGFLNRQGLGDYYTLRDATGGAALRVADEPATIDATWLTSTEEDLARQEGQLCTLTMDAQGIHCAACVWLIEKLFWKQEGAERIVVNPSIGKLELVVGHDFALKNYADTLSKFGYRLGPSLKASSEASSELLSRMGVCIALSMNTMLFAVAMYAGLKNGPIFDFFGHINFALGTLSLWVGGTVFIRSAIQGLKQRVLHLDIPIALGIVMAYASSTWAYFAHLEGSVYFDTLTAFIALMLVGRWLQARLVEKNRMLILESDGVAGLLTRRIEPHGVAMVRCTQIVKGDRLLIAASDIVPVECVLESSAASVAYDWITGESAPQDISSAGQLNAGARNVGSEAFVVIATQNFEDSRLARLLSLSGSEKNPAQLAGAFWQVVSKAYVVGIIGLGVIGFSLWAFVFGNVAKAFEVTTAVWIVSCPCAFAIGVPLAYEFASAGLRRAGLFVRNADFFDRARAVQDIVFDKTGTLTTGHLDIKNKAALKSLSGPLQQVLYNMTVRSAHPKSQAIAKSLSALGAPRFDATMVVIEKPGVGLEYVGDAVHYCLKNSATSANELEPETNLVFSANNIEVARFEFAERLRSDAQTEIAALQGDGYKVWMLSGDTESRVKQLAAETTIDLTHALSAQTPERKAAFFLDARHQHALMIGDGINDGLAMERALCAGTPSIDRPFVPARSDFYFTTEGLSPVRLALRASRTLRRVIQRNLAVAVLYNTIALTAAFAGLMTPLWAALLMPVSSLSVLLSTAWSLSPRSALWRY